MSPPQNTPNFPRLTDLFFPTSNTSWLSANNLASYFILEIEKVRTSIHFSSHHLSAPVLTHVACPYLSWPWSRCLVSYLGQLSTYTVDPIHQQSLVVNMSKAVYLSFPLNLFLLVFPISVNGNSISPYILAKKLKVVPDSFLTSVHKYY